MAAMWTSSGILQPRTADVGLCYEIDFSWEPPPFRELGQQRSAGGPDCRHDTMHRRLENASQRQGCGTQKAPFTAVMCYCEDGVTPGACLPNKTRQLLEGPAHAVRGRRWRRRRPIAWVGAARGQRTHPQPITMSCRAAASSVCRAAARPQQRRAPAARSAALAPPRRQVSIWGLVLRGCPSAAPCSTLTPGRPLHAGPRRAVLGGRQQRDPAAELADAGLGLPGGARPHGGARRRCRCRRCHRQ